MCGREEEQSFGWPDAANRLTPADYTSFDRETELFFSAHGQPSLIAGLVADGKLVHWRGFGETDLKLGISPTPDSVYRIASMTKSFTATAVLLLRDRGSIRLQDRVADYISELDLGLNRSDDGAAFREVTLHQLLTMQSGLPTDDAWADRQQGLSEAGFVSLLQDGVKRVWTPGTRFEYSNLGYALLGRVVALVTEQEFGAFLQSAVLSPLGMRSTGFNPENPEDGSLAVGYRRRDKTWEQVPSASHGAFSPMGGLFSSLSDLVRWISFYSRAFAANDAQLASIGEVVSLATRREAQSAQVILPLSGEGVSIADLSSTNRGYGYGLFIDENSSYGRIVYHSGGYPGFGSHMRWHPESGLGTVILANSTYADVYRLGSRLMTTLLGNVRSSRGFAPPNISYNDRFAVGGRGLWPATLDARRRVNSLIGEWSDFAASRLFAPSASTDDQVAENRAKFERARHEVGSLSEPDEGCTHESPAHCSWWLEGTLGRLNVSISMTPERIPRVQGAVLTTALWPDESMKAVLREIARAVNGYAFSSLDLAFCESLDPEVVLTRGRIAGLWAGQVKVGAPVSGDGREVCGVRLEGLAGDVVCEVVLKKGELQELEFVLELKDRLR